MKQEIDIPDLPKGYKAVAYRVPIAEEYYLYGGRVLYSNKGQTFEYLIVEKIKPSRIVLEEISREEYYRLFHDEQCTEIYNLQGSYWIEVKEGEE